MSPLEILELVIPENEYLQKIILGIKLDFIQKKFNVAPKVHYE
jgi:hypothetical protein